MLTKPIIIVGPTTVGKTDVAYALAVEMGGEVVNGDAYEMYREFQLCNGTSDALQHEYVPKHLYRVLDPMTPKLLPEEYARLAIEAIRDILRRGRRPIIEVYQLRYLAALRQLLPEYLLIGLDWDDRSQIEARVRRRWDKAFGQGLVDEVREMMARGYSDTYVMSKSLVAPIIMAHIEQGLSFEQAREQIVRENVELAGRDYDNLQMVDGVSWLKHDPADMEATLEGIKKLAGYVSAGV